MHLAKSDLGPRPNPHRVIAFPPRFGPGNHPRPPAPNPTPAGFFARKKRNLVPFSQLPPPKRGVSRRFTARKPTPDGHFRPGADPGKPVSRRTLLVTPLLLPWHHWCTCESDPALAGLFKEAT